MLFQREKKKELWRYASKNCAPANGGTQTVQTFQITRQQMPQHHQLQTIPSNHYSESGCKKKCTSSLLSKAKDPHCNTPPPPYCSEDFGEQSVPGSSCIYSIQYPNGMEFEKEINASVPESFRDDIIDSENFVTDISAERYNSSCSSCNSYHQLRLNTMNFQTNPAMIQQIYVNPTISDDMAPTNPASPTNFATVAVNMFRNYCSCGFFNERNDNSTLSVVHPQISNKPPTSPVHSSALEENQTNLAILQDFNLLMKHLKSCQISLLLKAVKSRKLPFPQEVISNQHLNCILIKRTSIVDEEPCLKTCRLFFWSELKTIKEIRRLPLCLNEKDPIYVCCNPLHWYRVVPTDVAPPPYQIAERRVLIKEESAQSKSVYGNKIMNKTDSMIGATVESQTTDGEDNLSYEKSWCEVAYWELTQRIGARHLVKSNSFNIYNEKSNAASGAEDICLKKLVNSNEVKTPKDVNTVRQKIGLGVTFCHEIDGVWLYNRSTVPIFLHSPTVYETWMRALKVLPGDCVKAFDLNWAQEFNYQLHLPAFQPGPIDTKSIRLSFAKGWGCDYKRQDITGCPCWLEVFFKKQR